MIGFRLFDTNIFEQLVEIFVETFILGYVSIIKVAFK